MVWMISPDETGEIPGPTLLKRTDIVYVCAWLPADWDDHGKVVVCPLPGKVPADYILEIKGGNPHDLSYSQPWLCLATSTPIANQQPCIYMLSLIKLITTSTLSQPSSSFN